jgi:hypothetical protein
MNAPSDKQRTWLSASYQPLYFKTFGSWRQSRDVRDWEQTYEEYLDEWQSQLINGSPIVTTRGNNDQLQKAIVARLPKVDKFGLEALDGFKIELDGKLVDWLILDARPTLTLRDCAIRNISCRSGSKSRLVLTNCWIGQIEIGVESLIYFEMTGGGVGRLESPLPTQQNPFLGSASILNVKFSSDAENAQAYRNMRHHLSAIHNQEAASIFHSAEMRTLFKQQNRLDQAFNLIYRGVSDYGNSTTRPLWLFSLFALLNFIVFVATDGVTIPKDVADTGWQLALHNVDNVGNILRSATITLTQIVNPLGIFGLKTLVTAKSLLLAVVNVVLCLFSTLCLAFFAFAVRRRFRLAQE